MQMRERRHPSANVNKVTYNSPLSSRRLKQYTLITSSCHSRDRGNQRRSRYPVHALVGRACFAFGFIMTDRLFL